MTDPTPQGPNRSKNRLWLIVALFALIAAGLYAVTNGMRLGDRERAGASVTTTQP